jgi:hypothetical protein
MSLNHRLAYSNGNPKKTILALRMIRQERQQALSRRLAGGDVCSAENRAGNNEQEGGQSIPHKSKQGTPMTTSLLERVANSNGDAQRTIAALRLIIAGLERKLSKLPDHFDIDEPAS